MNTKVLLASAAFALLAFACRDADAQAVQYDVVQACGMASINPGFPGHGQMDITGRICTVVGSGTGSTVAGSQSNAGAGTTGSTNLGTNSYGYLWNSTGWVQAAGTAAGQFIQGTSANAATDDGSNPVKVGGVFATTPATLTDGQRGQLTLGADGSFRAMAVGAFATGADGINNANLNSFTPLGTATSTVPRPLVTAGWIFGLSAWARQRDMTGAGLTGAGTTAFHIAPVTTSTGAPGTPVTGTAVTSIVAKAAPGNLYGFNVVASTTAGFVVDNNTTAAPSTSAATTPLYCVPVAAGGTTVFRSEVPIKGTVGHVLLFSTSCTVYTPVSPAAVFMQSEAP